MTRTTMIQQPPKLLTSRTNQIRAMGGGGYGQGGRTGGGGHQERRGGVQTLQPTSIYRLYPKLQGKS